MSTSPLSSPESHRSRNSRAADHVSQSRFTLYMRPAAKAIALSVQPALASWDRKGSPSQERLATFLSHVKQVIEPEIPPSGPVAISLDIALPRGVDPLVHHDLDNYLDGIGRTICPGRAVAIFGRKSVDGVSAISVGPAVEADPVDLQGWSFAGVQARGSAQHASWKELIEAAVAAQAELAPGDALAMHVAFVVGSNRNWVGLWKPALDALTPILGSGDGRRFNPRDDRIVDLGLHLSVDEAVGYDVLIGYWWRAIGGAERSSSVPPSALKQSRVQPVARFRSSSHAPTTLGGEQDRMSYVTFENDDEGYVAWLQAHPLGYVVNTNRSRSPSYRKLHRSGCAHVSRLQRGFTTWTTGDYIKICAVRRQDLEDWSMKEGGVDLQDGCYCCR